MSLLLDRERSKSAQAQSCADTVLSERVRLIKLSPTIAMAERAAAYRRTGTDVISLALGELDFDTPRHIVDAAHEAACKGFTRYTAADGAPLIKNAVREKLTRDNALTYANEEIHVASGAKQVIHNAFAATLNPGDEVVLFAPYWVSYSDVVEFCGGTPVVLPTSLASGFLPDPAHLERAITSRTKWVVINSPNNPTGAVYSEELLARLASAVKSLAGAMLLSDEIYEHLVYDGRISRSLGVVAPELRERMLIVNGVSKSYAMTGWRLGFAAGPSWLIEAMGKVQSQTAGNTSTISQAAAAAALTGDQSLIPIWRRILERRRDLAVATLRRASRLRVAPVSGAFYVFADVRGCIGCRTPNGRLLHTDVDVAEYFLDDAGVAVVPGEAFGASPYVRVSFALDEPRVEQACQRLVAACDTLAPSEKG